MTINELKVENMALCTARNEQYQLDLNRTTSILSFGIESSTSVKKLILQMRIMLSTKGLPNLDLLKVSLS